MSEVVKQAKISYSELPPINTDLGGYPIRYRIVSDNRNKISHWSPIFLVDPGYSYVSSEGISISKVSSVISASWNPVGVYKGPSLVSNVKNYDIWVRFDKSDNGDWIYVERSSTPYFSIQMPTTYFINGVDQATHPNRISIEIYVEGNPIFREDGIPNAIGVTPLKRYQELLFTI
jgi:hypothetical protein